MKQKSKVRENSEYAKSACISTVFPFGVLAPDGRARGHQWHSRGQRFDPAYLHQKVPKFNDFGTFSLFLPPFLLMAIFIYFCLLVTYWLHIPHQKAARISPGGSLYFSHDFFSMSISAVIPGNCFFNSANLAKAARRSVPGKVSVFVSTLVPSS